jgi:hypothetical protein
MALSRRIDIVPLQRTLAGGTLFFSPQNSDETLISQIAQHQSGQLFCHRRQTDQLMVLRGAIDLVVLQERRLRRISLREDEPAVVRIPPGIPHGAINRGSMPAMLVNAVLRHGPPDPRDYLPRPVPACLVEQWRTFVENFDPLPLSAG